jgi:hypothetical protein
MAKRKIDAARPVSPPTISLSGILQCAVTVRERRSHGGATLFQRQRALSDFCFSPTTGSIHPKTEVRLEALMAKNLLHKYVNIATLKRILGGSIRVTQPGAFNDPFELLPEIIVRTDQPEERISFSFDILSPRRANLLEAVVPVTDGHVASDFTSRNILDELNQQIGILCLSKSPNSILMWSHYADQYQGAVIAFDADHEFFTGQIPVEYVEERPKKHIDSYKSEPIPLAELCGYSRSS